MAERGRPSGYSAELADDICERLAKGEGLNGICKAEDMPTRSMVYRWLEEREDFRDKYARARLQQADHYAEEIIQISDDGRNDTYKDDDGFWRVNHDIVARSKLRIDARKWAASKLAPKKYGDKAIVETSGPDGGPQRVEVSLSPETLKAIGDDLLGQ